MEAGPLGGHGAGGRASTQPVINRIPGVLPGTVYSWVKKARQARELMLWEVRRRKQQLIPARVIAFDEVWTYVKVRRKRKLREVWVWTAAAEADCTGGLDFQGGDRSERTFLKLPVVAGGGALPQRPLSGVRMAAPGPARGREEWGDELELGAAFQVP